MLDTKRSTIDKVPTETTAVPTGIAALLAGYREGGLQVRTTVEALLERIAARGEDGVWISVASASTLRARAAELDARGAAGLPLFGVPVAVKDNIDVAGLPTTAACPAFARVPDRDAGAVRRLRDAGALVVGKTNLDQFATGLTGQRSPYGGCESVFGGDLISGGSSSGSAVAVAAGLVPVALGTDTAGSGRVPAALNGIVGLKPTRGLIGTSGVVPACRSLDCVSVFTTDLGDAASVLAVLAGPDPDDPWSRTGVPLPPVAAPRLALPADLGPADGLDQAMGARFDEVASVAAGRAAGVVHTPVDALREAGDLLYDGPWVAERLAALTGFLADHRDDVLPVTRAVIERGSGYDAVATFRARHRLQELRAWCRGLFVRADVLLLPTVPTTFTRAEIAADPVGRNAVLGRYTQFTNLLDLAAVAVPAGFTADGRPCGVTLVGPAFSETRLLAAAAALVPVEVP
ncbi:Allophanate hydrolase [Pseudonocardia dioxanivorans CB1190]|uniref:Allophanate hydrolase n=1 Tax=Pseudonocardia dioxanivorans (strain ATCC 55486 / DSM 44775 / JCM 13855 / CB1190) TaxID=675635 RepID=F4CVE1_PSEUX|nr:Allophanate hydrolase [Pseudonocardia dioxanivorans CB1190]